MNYIIEINFNGYCANYELNGCKFLKMPRLRNIFFWTSSQTKYIHDREYRFDTIQMNVKPSDGCAHHNLPHNFANQLSSIDIDLLQIPAATYQANIIINSFYCKKQLK